MIVDQIEKRTLKVTVFTNLIMAVAGWFTFNLTGSQAMLLDGNFSFVLAIATTIALYISKIKHKKTKTFPFGSYIFEAAFVLSKGLLILGIVIAAFLQNTQKIIDFFNGEFDEPIIMTPIYYYTFFILIIVMSLLLFFKNQNKKINNQSSLLLVESASSKIDGALTFATGLAFFLISFVVAGSTLDVLLYIGDSIIVIILCLIMIGSPLSIIKNAFIELTGGSIQNEKEKQKIEQIINKVVNSKFTYDTYISKIGSGYVVVLYIEPNSEMINVKELKRIHKDVKEKLQEFYPALLVELSLKE